MKKIACILAALSVFLFLFTLTASAETDLSVLPDEVRTLFDNFMKARQEDFTSDTLTADPAWFDPDGCGFADAELRHLCIECVKEYHAKFGHGDEIRATVDRVRRAELPPDEIEIVKNTDDEIILNYTEEYGYYFNKDYFGTEWILCDNDVTRLEPYTITFRKTENGFVIYDVEYQEVFYSLPGTAYPIGRDYRNIPELYAGRNADRDAAEALRSYMTDYLKALKETDTSALFADLPEAGKSLVRDYHAARILDVKEETPHIKAEWFESGSSMYRLAVVRYLLLRCQIVNEAKNQGYTVLQSIDESAPHIETVLHLNDMWVVRITDSDEGAIRYANEAGDIRSIPFSENDTILLRETEDGFVFITIPSPGMYPIESGFSENVAEACLKSWLSQLSLTEEELMNPQTADAVPAIAAIAFIFSFVILVTLDTLRRKTR